MFRICCLIPAFNEKDNLEPLLKRLSNALDKKNLDYKILLIIQGDDGSDKLVEHLKKIYRNLEYKYFPYPLGIGNAYRIGFDAIDRKYTHVLTMDADLNHDPEDLTKFLSEWDKNSTDLIIGSRFIKGGKFNEPRIWKKFSSIYLNKFICQIFKIKVHDISSGYRLINNNSLKKLLPHLRENGYPSYMELAILSHFFNFKLGEVSINYKPRRWGVSKMGKGKTIIDYFFFLLRLLVFWKNPDK